jgi:hypothetical protein
MKKILVYNTGERLTRNNFKKYNKFIHKNANQMEKRT